MINSLSFFDNSLGVGISGVSRLVAMAVVAVVSVSAESRAGIIVNIFQDGANVKATVSGAFNTDVDGRRNSDLADGNFVAGGEGLLNGVYFDGTPGNIPSFSWTGTIVGTPPASSWGSGDARFSNATLDSLTGVDGFWILLVVGKPEFSIARNYESGRPISGSWTIANTTMTALGIDNYGSYEYSFGSTTTDTVTVNLLQANPIPEPSALLLVGSVVGAGLVRRRRR